MTKPSEADLRVQLARAQARLKRERAARRESEDIAEATLLRLFQRQQELDLFSQVTSIANSASDSASALRDAMDLIRTSMQWQVGHYFVPAQDDASALVSSGQWSGDPQDPFLLDLRSATSGMRFPPGLGLPGTAFVAGATWEENIGESRNFPRQRWIKLGSAFAFPILVGEEVVAVMEFIHPTPRPRQQGVLDLAGVLGIQLGRVVERMRSRQHELEHRDALQNAVEERTADLIAARNRAEAQSQARATLFSTISHDLQTPLHEALSELEAASEGSDVAEHVSRASLYLSELQQRISALVDLAGPTGSGGLDRPRVVDLGRVLQDVVAAHEDALGRAGGQLELALTSATGRSVLVDVDRFRRIVHTLLVGHLIDGASGPLRLRLEVRSSWAELAVEEPSPGPRSTTLALVVQLAESSGGTAVHTALAEGRRRVDVRLPVAVQGRGREGSGRRVLLVDDIAVTRQISAAMLSRMGAEVRTAANGREALAELSEGDFALVLMDLRMPVMGGLEASRRIRAGEAGPERSDVPIVALTAHAAAGDADQSLLAGMDAHMTKPFTLADLRETIRRYVPDLASQWDKPG